MESDTYTEVPEQLIFCYYYCYYSNAISVLKKKSVE